MRIHQDLYWACRHGKTAEAKRLIAEGAPVDWQNEYGETPLHMASCYGHTEILMLLLENKCNLNVTDYDGNTPLVHATYHNKMAAVETLVEEGCDITFYGETAYDRALEMAFASHKCLFDVDGKFEDYFERVAPLVRFLPSARDASGRLRRVGGRATRALRRDLLVPGMLPIGPLSLIEEFATGNETGLSIRMQM